MCTHRRTGESKYPLPRQTNQTLHRPPPPIDAYNRLTTFKIIVDYLVTTAGSTVLQVGI